MPEGDSLHRAAARLQPLVGLRLAATSPHPRGLVTGVAKAVDGRRLEGVEAVGKNLLLRFEGGVTVRSHLRMNGRWRVGRVGSTGAGRPWLVLRGETIEATQWNGPVLTLDLGPVLRLGPDLLADGSDPAVLVARLRRGGRLAAARRGAPGSAARRGHREHVDVGGALGRPRVAVDSGGRGARRGAPRGVGMGTDGDARVRRGSAAAAGGLPPCRSPLRALWDADRVARPGRRQPHRLLVPRVPTASPGRPRIRFTAWGRGYVRGMTASTLALPARYRGPELIATGGMADVYAATDDTLDRRVAIKILNERFAGDPEIRTRFAREARIAARLSVEPNVITIFDVADVAGQPAIVMEFLPGGTLADRMRAGRIPPALALAWLAQAGRALDAAHAANVVHRDVKPANLMLGADGEVRVTDFGIARIAGDVALTSVGTILGTSGYMSPEQAVGGTATAASDRYGLAVVAFELLCGRRPYLAETFAAEAAAHASAPIPKATGFDRSLPPAIDAVLERALAKDPAERFRSCGELVASLKAAFADSAGTTVRIIGAGAPTAATDAAAPRSRHVSRRSGRTIGIAAALGALALVGVVLAATVGGGGDTTLPPTTVVRTATVAGETQVRTVTVEAQPANPATTQGALPVTAASTASGSALNDQGFRLLDAGDADAALPILERAVAALRGSGSLTEAYALYNLALARFSTGNCEGITELLDSSESIQGHRSEIKRLQHQVDKGCDG